MIKLKNLFLCLGLLFCQISLNAQAKSTQPSISVAYLGQVFIQPGVKVSSHFNLKTWPAESEQVKKVKHLFISPQLGYYAWPGNNFNLLANVEIGYQRQKTGRNSFSSLSLGLGYLNTFQITSIVYDQSDGSIDRINRKRKAFFLPTINYEFGRSINDRLSWYNKYALGLKLSAAEERSMLIFFELGLRFNINQE